MKQLGLLVILLMSVISAQADQSVTGQWQTIDDETGEAKSIVEIYERDGRLFGKIVDLLLKPKDSLCKECKDELHMKPIIGMEIVTGLEKDGDKYSGGKILDPENGKTYSCKLWLEDGKLQVRGYIGFFFRTQTWSRPALEVVAK